MPLYTSSITVDQVIDALGDFIAPFVSPAVVVRGQVNRVPMPTDPCVVLTELLQTDMSVPATEYQPTLNTATVEGPTQINVQIDFYGPNSGEYCKAVKTAFRSQWGFANFPAYVKPLYTSDGMQTPLTTGEQQYESRWTLTASMQYNPVITVPQQFADVALMALVAAVDV